MTKPRTDFNCAMCGGTGAVEPDCIECMGNGWVDDPDDGGTMMCPECLDEKCPYCEGTGEAPEDAR